MDVNQEIQNIAREAIASINRLVSLNAAGTSTSFLNSSPSMSHIQRQQQPQNQQQSTSHVAPSPHQSRLTELWNRFPTAGSSARRTNFSRRRVAPYYDEGVFSAASTATSSRRSRAPPERPSTSDFVTKDVIVVLYGTVRAPTKSEKVKLERLGQVITCFDVNRTWTSNELRFELQKLLPISMKGLPFEIVKNSAGYLIEPTLPVGREIDGKALCKSISPSGAIYLRLLTEFLFDDEEDDGDDNAALPVFGYSDNLHLSTEKEDNTSGSETVANTNSQLANQNDDSADSNTETPSIETTAGESAFDINKIVVKAKLQSFVNPVELLKFLQQEIVVGRKLEMTDLSDTIEGETNLITIDRQSVCESTFSEFAYIEDFRKTFQVDFIEEESVDLGGPRKEWIQLINREINEKYFKHGLRDLLSNDYYFVGAMLGVAFLQNGQMPNFIEEYILQSLVSNDDSSKCIVEMRKGLELMGLSTVLKEFTCLLHFFRPGAQQKINVVKLKNLLTPKFSENGSNAFNKEKEVYKLFIKYIREVAAGRRSCGELTLNLGSLLEFVMCASEEPVLGFCIDPSIDFVAPLESCGQPCFLPTAHTCSNQLILPRGTYNWSLPPEDTLFEIYDMAFSQKYFGKK